MPANHTPGPWTVHRNIGRKSEIGIMADAAPCIIATMGNQKAWPAEAKANAAFIVRACNCHDELVGALRNCLAYMEADSDDEQERLDYVQAATALAKGSGE